MQTESIGRQVAIFDDGHAEAGKRPWFGSLPEGLGEDFSFAVMGDRCGMATEGVFEQALHMLKDLKPDFVVAVGDMIEGYWRSTADAHEEWDEFDAKILASGLPFFPAVGNHDYGNRLMADVWRERKGLTYYAFRVGAALFITINTEHIPEELSDEFIDIVKRATANVKRDPKNAHEHLKVFYGDMVGALSPEQLQNLSKIKLSIGEQQMDFIRQVLENNKDAKWTFVNMHKPGWKSVSAEYRELLDMLSGRPYTIFAGHLHSLEYEQGGDCERIQMGRTGGLVHGDGTEARDENMLLWVTVRGGKPFYRVIHMDGIRDIAAYAPKQMAVNEGV